MTLNITLYATQLFTERVPLKHRKYATFDGLKRVFSLAFFLFSVLSRCCEKWHLYLDYTGPS